MCAMVSKLKTGILKRAHLIKSLLDNETLSYVFGPSIKRQGRSAGDKLAQQVKMFTAVPDNLSLMSEILTEKERTNVVVYYLYFDK